MRRASRHRDRPDPVTHAFRTVVGADGWERDFPFCNCRVDQSRLETWEGTANDVSCVRCRYQINPDGTPAV